MIYQIVEGCPDISEAELIEKLKGLRDTRLRYTNASMMGYIGVVVSSTKSYKKISRVGEYIKTLRQLEKAPADLFCNTVPYREDEFEELLRRHIPQN